MCKTCEGTGWSSTGRDGGTVCADCGGTGEIEDSDVRYSDNHT